MGKVAHSYQMCIRNLKLADLLVLNRHLACPDIQKININLGRTKYLCELLERDKPDILIGYLVKCWTLLYKKSFIRKTSQQQPAVP